MEDVETDLMPSNSIESLMRVRGAALESEPWAKPRWAPMGAPCCQPPMIASDVRDEPQCEITTIFSAFFFFLFFFFFFYRVS
jgi:hypothetical protein